MKILIHLQKKSRRKTTYLSLLLIALLVTTIFPIVAKSEFFFGRGVTNYYPLNGDANNYSPNKIDGSDAFVYGASPSFDRFNHFNSAYTFDGIDNYMVLGAPLCLQTFSVGIWYNSVASKEGTILYWENAGIKISLIQDKKKNGKLSCQLGIVEKEQKTYTSRHTSNDGNWHHFFLTFDGEKFLVYEDGSQPITVKHLTDFTKSKFWEGKLYIGVNPNQRETHFQGRVDEIIVYNRAITPIEVERVFELPDISFAHDFENGHVYHLPFDGGLVNKSLNKVHLEKGNVYGATLSSDRYGEHKKSYHFDGIDDFITLGKKIKHSYVTATFWFNTTSTASGRLIGWGEDSGFNIYLNDPNAKGQISAIINTDKERYSFSTNKDINDGQWHFLAFTFDGNSIKAYLDGSLFHHANLPGTLRRLQYGEEDLEIGRGKTGLYRGRIDELHIFNRALNRNEISALYNEAPEHQKVRIFSNPNSNQTIEILIKNTSKKNKAEILIFDSRGKVIIKDKVKTTGTTNSFNLTEQKAQEFTVKVKLGSSDWLKKKIVFYEKIKNEM